jgi:hypothetical protein
VLADGQVGGLLMGRLDGLDSYGARKQGRDGILAT